MKAILRITALFILLAMLIAPIVSCSSDGGESTEDDVCTQHIDKNGDGKCDECGDSLPKAPCTEHIDENKDYVCDECGAAIEKKEIMLIDEGEALFELIYCEELSSEVITKIEELANTLSSFGITVLSKCETEPEESACEVLIGGVSSRGERYIYKSKALGTDGYAIVGIDEKIVIAAECDESYLFALEVFTESVLGIYEDTEEICDVSFSEDIVYSSGYAIESITVRGRDISGYTVAVDLSDELFSASAENISNAIYSASGYNLPIVDLSEAEKSIILKRVSDAGDAGFRITTTEDGALLIECEYYNKLESALGEFLAYEIQLKSGNVDFAEDYLYEKNISIVTYDEFGARGNGVTDDYEAIFEAHAFANQCGQTVVATPGKDYLIRNITDSIYVKTNVVWEGATITIDDRDLKYGDQTNRRSFYFPAEYSKKVLTGDNVLTLFPEGKIDRDNLYINWNYDFPALVVIYNDDHKNYRRYEGTETAGSSQMEFISVDKDGNISADTPLLFDYEKVTKVEIFRTDDTPITVRGGTINTLASQVPREASANYLGRGMTIKRSNTTFVGVKHYIEGELDKTKAHPSTGFFFIEDSQGVTLLDCVLTGRTAGGSYDLSLYRSNEVLLKNCTQSNFFKKNGDPSMHDNEYWGIMGSNYCKNVTFDTCTLSRFDAHQGIYNAKIINSTINAIEVIGGGTFLVENTTFYLSRALMFDLRSDYGSTFKGEIVIRNCHVVNYNPTATAVIKANWHNVYFGYECTLPNIIIDGLTFDEVIGDVTLINIIATRGGYDYKYDTITEKTLIDGTENKNPIIPPDYIKILNNDEGYNYVLTDVYYFYDVELEGGELK